MSDGQCTLPIGSLPSGLYYYQLQLPEQLPISGKMWQLTEGATNTPFNGWDGKIAEQFAATGVYVWSAQIRLINGEVVALKGEVLLVR